jgi:hypothetical protein
MKRWIIQAQDGDTVDFYGPFPTPEAANAAEILIPGFTHVYTMHDAVQYLTEHRDFAQTEGGVEFPGEAPPCAAGTEAGASLQPTETSVRCGLCHGTGCVGERRCHQCGGDGRIPESPPPDSGSQ